MISAVTQAPNGGVVVVEADDPEARAGSVVVDVRTALLDAFDRAVYRGGDGAAFPLVQGGAGAGTLVTGGGALVVGSKVVVWPWVECGRCGSCRARQPERCAARIAVGRDRSGMFASRAVVPRRAVVQVPQGIGPAVATMAVRYAPAWRMLHHHGAPEPGTKVLVVGPASDRQPVATLADRLGLAVQMAADPGESAGADLVLVAGPVEGLGSHLLAPHTSLVLAPAAAASTGAFEPGVVAERAIRIGGCGPASRRDFVALLGWMNGVNWPDESATVASLRDVGGHLADRSDRPVIVVID